MKIWISLCKHNSFSTLSSSKLLIQWSFLFSRIVFMPSSIGSLLHTWILINLPYNLGMWFAQLFFNHNMVIIRFVQVPLSSLVIYLFNLPAFFHEIPSNTHSVACLVIFHPRTDQPPDLFCFSKVTTASCAFRPYHGTTELDSMFLFNYSPFCVSLLVYTQGVSSMLLSGCFHTDL